MAVLLTEHKDRCFVDNLFAIFECLCSQDGGEDFKKISSRIVSIFMRFLAIMVIGSFGAVITSYLAVEIPEIPFKNLEEFDRHGRYQLITVKSDYTEVFFNVR